MEKCDVVVLTVIPAELSAVQKALGCDASKPEKLPTGTLYWRVSMFSKRGGRDYSICIAGIGKAGNEDASAAVTELLHWFEPQLAILVGIAAGVRGKNKIGNVLIGENVFAYDRGAIEEGKFVARPVTHELVHSLRQEILAYSAQDELVQALRARTPVIPPPPKRHKQEHREFVATELSMAPATIASGNKLLRDANVLKSLREDGHGQIEAGEMEGAGFATACTRNNTPWLILRGVSDFGDKLKSDAYHRYAAQSAAICTVALLAEAIELPAQTFASTLAPVVPALPVPAPPDVRYHHHGQLTARLETALAAVQTKAKFNLSLSIGRNYEAVHRNDFVVKGISATKLAGRAELKQLIIHSPGGCGKSTFLYRFAIEAINAGFVTFFVNMKGGYSSQEKEATVANLFELSFAGSYADFERARQSGSRTLLVVDGLNEILGSESEALLARLANLAHEHPTVHVVVADRMNAQRAASTFFRAIIDPLSPDEVARNLPPDKKLTRAADKQLLSMPFFLDLQLLLWSRATGGEAGVLSRQDMFLDYLVKICGVKENALPTLAEVSLEAYRKHASRTMDRDWWREKVGAEIAESLERAGAVVLARRIGAGQMVAFRHQLIHDFLVGYSLARTNASWSGENFDAATFEANSVEPISFAAEMLGAPRADHLVLAVYDWNYPASIEAVVDLEGAVDISPISADLKFALTAVNAEKLLDLFEETAQGARKRLQNSGWSAAQKFANVGNFDELLAPVKAYTPSEERAIRWKESFLLVSPRKPNEEQLMLLWGEPLGGWTIANVLRRLLLSGESLAQLRLMYRIADVEQKHTVCWRIVHVLGKFPSKETIELLKAALVHHPYHWVRYGALRSLMEVSFHSITERAALLEWLRQELPRFAKTTSILREVRRTALVTGADPNWYHSIESFVVQASQDPRAESEREQWDQIIREIRKRAQQTLPA